MPCGRRSCPWPVPALAIRATTSIATSPGWPSTGGCSKKRWTKAIRCWRESSSWPSLPAIWTNSSRCESPDFCNRLSTEIHSPAPTDCRPKNNCERLARELHAFVDAQYDCWNQQLLPALRREGIRILSVANLDRAGHDAMDLFFTRQVDPILTPVTIDPSHPFPHVLNKALCVAFQLRRNSKPGTTYLGVVTVPRKLPRLVRVPTRTDSIDYIFLHDLIETHTRNLYKGYQGHLFGRISRHPQQQSLSARGRVPQPARSGGHPTAQPPQGRRGTAGDRGRAPGRNRRSAVPAIRAASPGRCSRPTAQ